ncbi:1,2-phenylacetyl-CoA epoxidase subunit PaaC [Sphingomonas sp. PP-CC-3G-468]|uniref:1,2-phenylacetyl-CoA epoxidase subunit PaaC n=1 Tax=Sphingomonas sp. PP-CC-3G-468 TaxID=2135656 RepID=UPI00104F42D1|nr:1,2-phenylacetyl-CoA epoxidase subunit PaaC [Sphingomonas sp. PP-CC-3G-468]TCM02922.1 ring-1,2-phenylacetyl-CoA epoxidase subunit PaaC [Sphingomonas sp. PP-CC-3G-468]
MADAFQNARLASVLALGDDSLILGQRLGEWCGHAPTVELDLSIANFGLDLIGQAQLFLDHAGQLEGEGRDGDALAFRRDVYDFRNCLMVEQPNGDFGQTIVRQWLFSTWQRMLFEAMTGLKDERLAEISAKAVKEVAYHERVASDWVIRLGDGTDNSHARVVEGLAWNWRFVDELFVVDPAERPVIDAGLAVDRSVLRPAWDAAIDSVLAEAGLDRPGLARGVTGGRIGRHSEHLGHILSEMQFLQRAYPGASW